MLNQALNQQLEQSCQINGRILNQLRNPLDNVRYPLCNKEAEFAQETAYLVRLCRTRSNEALTPSVHQ